MNETELKTIMYRFCERAMEQFSKEDVLTLTAMKCDNYLTLLSGFSGLLEEEMGELELHKAKTWITFRKDFKSNIDAERAYEGTEEGLRTIKLKRLMNGVDKIISALKLRLRRLENQARNLY